MKGGTPIEPGVYYDMPSDEFAKADGLSQGSIKRLLKSPLHYIDRYRRPELYPTTRNLLFGQALHCYLLEPDRFEADYPKLPKVNRARNDGLDALIDFYLERTADVALHDVEAEIGEDTEKQAGKRKALAWLEERADFAALTDEEMALLTYMKQSWDLPEHKTVRNLFAGEGRNEVSLFWRDKFSGVLLKARLDRLTFLSGGTALAPDLKSTTDASYTGFSKSIPNYGYDIQAAMTIEGIQECFPTVDNVRFIFAAIEKSPPFGAAPYVFNDPQDIATGGRKARTGITLYQQCCELDEWPSYPDVIQPIGLPGWARSS